MVVYIRWRLPKFATVGHPHSQSNLQFNWVNQEKHAVNPLSLNNKDILEDWIADTEVYPEDYENSDWMSLDPPVDNRTPLAPPGEETEDILGTGLTDLDIFNGLKGVKEEI
ncbi:hypothetical protein F3Y22_tig00112738pilonHSYRG00488 [Hibiscus syriacus]|uniref:Uncharacterized protein n=1 Tax=Hibiscus syriacus TaxID=106335 RepID=A0A6A2X6Z8_HIBSY|nr:hypothetical protein F3Y22_tig00112738pilonHSYRG00488 [Hibiscus syriacus]